MIQEDVLNLFLTTNGASNRPVLEEYNRYIVFFCLMPCLVVEEYQMS